MGRMVVLWVLVMVGSCCTSGSSPGGNIKVVVVCGTDNCVVSRVGS